MRDRDNRRDERDPRDQPPVRPVERPPVPRITRIDLPPLPDPVEIKPAPVAEERSVKLPEPVSGLRVGGGGRFLFCTSSPCASSASLTSIPRRSSATFRFRKPRFTSPAA